MLGAKIEGSVKGGIVVCMVILLLGWLIYRNSNLLMRTLVLTETRWRTVAFSEEQSEHFIIKYTDIDKNLVPMIEEASEKAYYSVGSVFGRQAGQKTTLVVYPDEASLASSFGWDKDEKAMGVYWAGTIRILSPRVYLGGDAMAKDFYQEGPMVHEYAHLMVDEISNGNYNRWWTEGIAQYVEKKVTGFEFPEPTGGDYYDLATLEKKFDSLDQKVAYWESLKAVEFIVDNYGEDKLYTVLTYLGRGENMKQALENALNISYESFEMQLYNRLRG